MNPDPLYMLMKNMTQRPHGPRPYDGILGAQQEKVVAYEGEKMGTLDAAVSEAMEWVESSDSYRPGDEGTLIEIRVVAKVKHDRGGIVLSVPGDTTNQVVLLPIESCGGGCAGCKCGPGERDNGASYSAAFLSDGGVVA